MLRTTALVVFIVIMVAIVLHKKLRVEKKSRWTIEEVSELLQGWVDNKIDYEKWDQFESSSITDPKLDNIRGRALSITSVGSQYMKSGFPFDALTSEGKELFNKLIDECSSGQGCDSEDNEL